MEPKPRRPLPASLKYGGQVTITMENANGGITVIRGQLRQITLLDTREINRRSLDGELVSYTQVSVDLAATDLTVDLDQPIDPPDPGEYRRGRYILGPSPAIPPDQKVSRTGRRFVNEEEEI